MKKIFITLVIGAFVVSQSYAQQITGFGTLELNPFSNTLGVWASSINSTTATFTSVSDSDDPAIFTTLGSTVTLLGGSELSLKATLSSAAPSVDRFRITLYDSNYYSTYAEYSWSEFTGGNTVAETLVPDLGSGGAFSGTVFAWGLSTFGSGQSLTVTFDSLIAVPEPCVSGLVGVSLCGWALVRSSRRRV